MVIFVRRAARLTGGRPRSARFFLTTPAHRTEIPAMTTTTGIKGNTTGTKGNKVAYAVIGVFVAFCAVGWAIIMAYTEGTPGITPEVVSWQAATRSVRVHYQVSKPKSENVRCAIVAYDPSHAEIARVEVTVPPGTANVDTRQDVATSSLATAVDVRDCRTG
jgi:spore germination protein YaaH